MSKKRTATLVAGVTLTITGLTGVATTTAAYADDHNHRHSHTAVTVVIPDWTATSDVPPITSLPVVTRTHAIVWRKVVTRHLRCKTVVRVWVRHRGEHRWTLVSKRVHLHAAVKGDLR